MGKRSNFERKPKDFYKTPKEAVLPLINHIEYISDFIEPCAGDGQLVDILENFGKKCIFKSDIEPQRGDIIKKDAICIELQNPVITNPPWDRDILHPIIENIIKNNIDGWLLFDADWMYIKKSSELTKYCHKIVSVGRVKWFPETKMTGKDNCAWYLFKGYISANTQFIGRN